MKPFATSLALLAAAALLSLTAVTADAAPAKAPEGAQRNEFRRGGGFRGPSIPPITVEQARKLNDDAKVVLRGNLVQQVAHETYVFKDATGTINVEIEDKHWKGQVIAPEDTVEIFGEVDKDRNGEIKIEARRIFKR